MQEPILEKDYILLVQTNDKDLEDLLIKVSKEKNLHLEVVENSVALNKKLPDEQIVTFIIGSDVEDPIQSAQRLHAFRKRVKIIILSKNVETLKETIKFSPFIGMDVISLDESKETEVKESISEIIQHSLKEEKYREVVAETNTQLASAASSKTPEANQTFISKLLDVAPIGIAIVSQRGKILGWNKEAAMIFNKDEVQILGKQLFQFFGSQEGSKLDEYLLENFYHRETGQNESLILERKPEEKEKQILSFTAAPFTYSEGNRKALILTIKDVTEREQVKQELQDINETLEYRVQERTQSLLSYQDQLRSLASKLSKAEEKERQRLATELHDNLGQMLAVNKMKVDLINKDPLPEETVAEIEEVKEGMAEAISYTRDLMSDLKPPPTLDKEDVRATIEWLAKKMKKYQLEVIIEDDGQPKRTSEEIRTTLLQCVRELLFNIIKHTEVNSAFIYMSRQGRQVQIMVEDKGSGFSQKAEREATNGNGGFGLFNIRERLDFLGGSTEIISEPGKGTKVKLKAPLKSGDSGNKPTGSDIAQETPVAREPGQKIRVMLVDDHQMMREGLKKIVEAEEDMMVIAEASDGKEAVELARKTSPEIVIMDVDMPVMNGIDATRKIVSEIPQIRIVGLSFHDHKEVVESIHSAGATAYLSKNEAFETLVATIRSEVT